MANKERAINLLNVSFSAINKLTNRYAFDFSINQKLTQKFSLLYNKAMGIPTS